ncbi:MAG: hypothetical protein HeimC3_26000 [Candidatus Heimdallarchaeota archaeon LC_3]|nr:MAG: hypothetical protein HeimC3_26000 [Candidatus Heimdallarchaeota archaeon LC_3]
MKRIILDEKIPEKKKIDLRELAQLKAKGEIKKEKREKDMEKEK